MRVLLAVMLVVNLLTAQAFEYDIPNIERTPLEVESQEAKKLGMSLTEYRKRQADLKAQEALSDKHARQVGGAIIIAAVCLSCAIIITRRKQKGERHARAERK